MQKPSHQQKFIQKQQYLNQSNEKNAIIMVVLGDDCKQWQQKTHQPMGCVLIS